MEVMFVIDCKNSLLDLKRR